MIEEPWPLPAHWRWARFADVARVASDLVDPAEFLDAPHIAPNHIESETGRLLPFSTIRADGVISPKHRFHLGQVLYSKIRPYLAKVIVADFDGLCSADMYPIETELDARFLKWWMLTREFTRRAAGEQARTVLPKINVRALSSLPVPVAPMEEQRRIVEILEDHLSRLDAGLRAVEAALHRLQRIRASLGDQLLDRGWPSFTLRSVSLLVTDGDHNPPKRAPSGVPHITAKGIRDGRISLEGCTFVSEEGFKQTADRYRPLEGDVIVTCVGTIGEVAVVPPGLRFSADRNLAGIRADPSQVLPEYLALTLDGHSLKQRMRSASSSTAQPHLYLRDLRDLQVPLPDLATQDDVVRQAEGMTARARDLADTARLITRRGRALRRSTLAAAFSGTLSPSRATTAQALEPVSV